MPIDTQLGKTGNPFSALHPTGSSGSISPPKKPRFFSSCLTSNLLSLQFPGTKGSGIPIDQEEILAEPFEKCFPALGKGTF